MISHNIATITSCHHFTLINTKLPGGTQEYTVLEIVIGHFPIKINLNIFGGTKCPKRKLALKLLLTKYLQTLIQLT